MAGLARQTMLTIVKLVASKVVVTAIFKLLLKNNIAKKLVFIVFKI